MYKCICGREFYNRHSFASHCKWCKEHCEYEGREPEKRHGNIHGHEAWNKGLNKNNHPSIMISSYKISQALKGRKSPTLGNHLSDDSKSKMSDTRRERIISGDIKFNHRTGRGRCSKFYDHNENYHFLRSSYELIFAIFLCSTSQEFYTEDVRLKDNYGKIHISDFRIDNKIYEIKGIKSDKELKAKSLFESKGYEFYIVYKDKINLIENYLRNHGFDMDKILSKLSKDYIPEIRFSEFKVNNYQ